MVAILSGTCILHSIESTKALTMTTTDYLLSKGYSAEEIQTIMEEIEYYNQTEYLLGCFRKIETARAAEETEFEDIPF
jgi:hypothetical protein